MIMHQEGMTKEGKKKEQYHLTLCLPVLSADNLGKHFGPRSGLTYRRA